MCREREMGEFNLNFLVLLHVQIFNHIDSTTQFFNIIKKVRFWWGVSVSLTQTAKKWAQS